MAPGGGVKLMTTVLRIELMTSVVNIGEWSER
jgi:hypothetical protein